MNPPWARRNRSPEIAQRAASVGFGPVGPEAAERQSARAPSASGRCTGKTPPQTSGICAALLFPVFLVTATHALGQERFEQEKLSIRGNKALPKTLYIAPWKRLGSPLDGGALNSRLEDKLDPVEQDLFRRELELHGDGYSLD